MTPFDRDFPGRKGQAPRARILKAYFGLSVGLADAETWTPRDVRFRLAEAVRVAHRAPGRVGPQVFGSNWPEIRAEYEDLVAQVQGGEDFRAGLRDRQGPTAAQVSRSDEAAQWQSRWLDHPELDQARCALQLWLRCKAFRRSFQAECKARGIAYATGNRRRDEACLVIGVHLMRARVPLDPETLNRKLAGVPDEDEREAGELVAA